MSRWHPVRLLVLGLVGSLVAGLLAVVPVVLPVSAASCGSGGVPASVVSWSSDGADSVAEQLDDDIGLVLGDPGVNREWELDVCVSVSGEVLGVVSSPVRVASTDVLVSEGLARSAVLGELAARSWVPQPAITPAWDGVQVAGLETWLALDRVGRDPWVTVGPVSVTVDGVTVTGRAVPVATVWRFTDGGPEVRCDGPGVVWSEADFLANNPDRCVKEWVHTSAVRDVTMAVAIEYEIRVSSSVSGSTSQRVLGGWYGPVGLTVGEKQAVGVWGERVAPPDPGAPPVPPGAEFGDCTLMMFAAGECDDGVLPESSRGGENECSSVVSSVADTGRRWWSVFTTPVEVVVSGAGAIVGVNDWDDVGGEIAEAWEQGKEVVVAGGELVVDGWGCVRWAAGELYELLPAELRFLLDVGIGCGRVGLEALSGAWEGVTQAAHAVSDPQGFIQEQVDMVMGIKTLIETEGLESFLGEMASEFIDEDLYHENKAQWGGKITCEIIVVVLSAVFTGGGALLARWGPKLAKLMDKLGDILPASARRKLDDLIERNGWDRDRDRDNPSDRDDDGSRCATSGVGCGCNSFPAGTLVLLRDGVYRPIELIEPGERVVSYDTETGVWSRQVVLAQWSAVETGSLATITLAGGSSITATDDHRFWVDSEGRWVQADDLSPGDVLLGPDGVTRVDTVTVAAQARSIVWELDIAVNDNFTVADKPGTNTLVHNCETLTQVPDEPYPSLDLLDAAQRQAILDYTGSGYSEINSALRGKAPMTDDIFDRVEAIEDALDELPVFKGEVRRGMGFEPSVVEQLRSGRFVDDGFLSTSMTEPFSGEIQLSIRSASGRVLGDASRFPYENEVLFRPGVRFDVVSYEEVDGVIYAVLEEVP